MGMLQETVHQPQASYPTPMPSEPLRRSLLVANRSARQVQDRLPLAIEQLRERRIEIIPLLAWDLKNLQEQIADPKNAIDSVIVAGGDGTLNQVVDALLERSLPLGVLPMGTANDLAHTLAIPTNIEKACEVISRGQIKRIDLGWVNGKHYFNVAGIGLSARITQQLDWRTKKIWGKLAYVFVAARVVWQARPFRAEIRSGGKKWQTKTVQIVVGNGRFFGGSLQVAEDATIDDRQLDLYSLEVRHWWEYLLLLPALRKGRFTDLPQVRTWRGQEFEILSRRSRRISTDGELTAHTPAVFRVIPGALQVFAPLDAPRPR